MERKISLQQVQQTVENAYSQYKNLNEGAPDSRLCVENPELFGIALVTTDGTTIVQGDTEAASPLGEIAQLPITVTLLSQNTPEELVKKSGTGCCCKTDKAAKPKIGLCARNLRALSAIVPQNDPEGKMEIVVSNLVNMTSGEPALCDKLYERLSADAADVPNKLAAADFYLYDDAASTVDEYLKLMSLKVSARQLAVLGATIAADGVNPLTETPVFDGRISQSVVALAALHGPHKCGKAWLMLTGLPAKASFGGAIVAILPGFGAIAAYSPMVNDEGFPVKAAKAIQAIAEELQLNVFASARVSLIK